MQSTLKGHWRRLPFNCFEVQLKGNNNTSQLLFEILKSTILVHENVGLERFECDIYAFQFCSTETNLHFLIQQFHKINLFWTALKTSLVQANCKCLLTVNKHRSKQVPLQIVLQCHLLKQFFLISFTRNFQFQLFFQKNFDPSY